VQRRSTSSRDCCTSTGKTTQVAGLIAAIEAAAPKDPAEIIAAEKAAEVQAAADADY